MAMYTQRAVVLVAVMPMVYIMYIEIQRLAATAASTGRTKYRQTVHRPGLPKSTTSLSVHWLKARSLSQKCFTSVVLSAP